MADLVPTIAKITAADLLWEDHGIFTVSMSFDYGGSGQGLPGYCLDEPRRDENGKFVGRHGTAVGMEFIMRLMAACGVSRWSELPSRTVMVLRQDDWGSMVEGVEPLPTENGKRFIFADLFSAKAA